MNKKTSALILSLLLSTSFLVNCQKAGNKKKGTGLDASAKTAEVVPTVVCDENILKIQTHLVEVYKATNNLAGTGKVTSEAKDKIKNNRNDMVTECNKILPLLENLKDKACLKSEDTKTAENSIYLEKMKTVCDGVSIKLKEDHGVDAPIVATASGSVAGAEAKTEIPNIPEILSTVLTLSADGQELLQEKNVNFQTSVIGGELKSGGSELQAGIDAGKTVCSLLKINDRNDDSKVLSFKILVISQLDEKNFNEYTDNLKYTKNNSYLNIQMTTEKSSQAKDKNADSVAPLGHMLCLNLDATKLDFKKILSALGKSIKSADVVSADHFDDSAESDQDEDPADVATVVTSAEKATDAPIKTILTAEEIKAAKIPEDVKAKAALKDTRAELAELKLKKEVEWKKYLELRKARLAIDTDRKNAEKNHQPDLAITLKDKVTAAELVEEAQYRTYKTVDDEYYATSAKADTEYNKATGYSWWQEQYDGAGDIKNKLVDWAAKWWSK